MQEIRSFNVFQTARVMAAIYLVIAAVVGMLVFLMQLLRGHFGRAIGALLLFPIGYGICGFIGVAIFCWLYNEVAKRIGGVEFEIGERSV
ncbi:MAG TPA: hypothetical protein VIX12_09065 [Candidatus Binataceae bacterium]